MTALRWLASPLTGTVGVLTGLGFLSIPLRQITSAKPAVTQPAAVVEAAKEIPAVLRLKLLAPAEHVIVETADARKLLDLTNQAPGESEHDVAIPFQEGKAELSVRIDLGGTETAAFFTLMPDGYEDQTRYITGNGEVAETLNYEWHAH